jgi:hypothetical protein
MLVALCSLGQGQDVVLDAAAFGIEILVNVQYGWFDLLRLRDNLLARIPPVLSKMLD